MVVVASQKTQAQVYAEMREDVRLKDVCAPGPEGQQRHDPGKASG